jgi:hypothetical protein
MSLEEILHNEVAGSVWRTASVSKEVQSNKRIRFDVEVVERRATWARRRTNYCSSLNL